MDGQRWEKNPRVQVSQEETLSLLMDWEPKEVSLFKNETGLERERESFDLQGSRGNRSLWKSGPARGGREVMGS